MKRQASELRDLSLDELDARYAETRKELFHLVNEWQRTKKIEKPHLLRQKRKEIARMLTIKTQKLIAE
jgi:large subunit ribosomal protein L29